MWVARDRNGDLTLFKNKPIKDEQLGWWWIDENLFKLDYFDEIVGEWVRCGDFQDLTWDDEPVEVTLVNSLQYKNEKLAHEYMSAVYKEEHNDCLFNFVTE